jgi:hypothetical protein
MPFLFDAKPMYKFILLFLLIPFIVCAQQKSQRRLKVPSSSKEWGVGDKLAEKEYQCFNSDKYNAKQRLSFFPFNGAVTIKLVSFADTNKIYTPIRVNNFSIDERKVIESRVLSKNGIDSLTNILYNVGRTPVKGVRITIADLGANCYEPRNAILFINDEGVITQYIELCFGCNKYYFSSSKIRMMETCEQKYDMLKAFFLKQGINYGPTKPQNGW